MAEKYVLVEHLSAIKTIIHETFQTTQRIKFTAFDVSSKYVVFGVSSGGIYIFSRESCQFLKLIPSTHGPAKLISVSDNEENLAIAVSTGLVIILEDCFDNLSFQQQVFSEHEGNTVTAIKWNVNDLYCGDSTGKVSVITLKNFLTKAMFQNPIACLMHLDSQIVQLDTHSRFLLVSTLTRSLLCDTETEKYRQIGKKNRDGCFGACFFNVGSPVEDRVLPQIRGAFQTVGDNEQLSLTVDENVKIYCARPGARLWQADFEGNVIFTHQFRQSLNKRQTNMIHLGETGAELKITRFDDRVKIGENFNFGKVFRFLNKFILTFNEDGFYIFEPSSSALLFWSAHLSNIKDIKIVNSSLYVWHRDLEISVMSLFSVEELILKSLFKNQYHLCGELIVEFFDDVQSLIETSKKIHLISVLETKLTNDGLLERLSPIIDRLKEFSRAPSLEKFKNGIVSVNAYCSAAVNLPESVENFQIDSNLEENIKPKKDNCDVLLEQYRINKINKNIETTDFIELMKSPNHDEIFDLLCNFNRATGNESCELWCKETYLKYLNTHYQNNLHSNALNYACEAFRLINNSNLTCRCNFPLPNAHQTVPEYYEVGFRLMEKSDDYDGFLKTVPYMQKFVLERIDDLTEIQLKLPLIIQFCDSQVIGTLSNKMTYDVWDDSTRLLLKLKSGHCLNCGEKIDVDGAFEWTDFGLLMVESIKAANAVKLFKRYAHMLPKGELNNFFYQYCIFSSVANVNLDILRDDGVKEQFGMSVGRYLQNKHLRAVDSNAIMNKPPVEVSNCDHCQLPLKIPIIEDCRKLNCGHIYHQVCFLYNKGHCPTCDPVL